MFSSFCKSFIKISVRPFCALHCKQTKTLNGPNVLTKTQQLHTAMTCHESAVFLTDLAHPFHLIISHSTPFPPSGALPRLVRSMRPCPLRQCYLSGWKLAAAAFVSTADISASAQDRQSSCPTHSTKVNTSKRCSKNNKHPDIFHAQTLPNTMRCTSQ